MERHELLVVSEENLSDNLFYEGPGDFLIKAIAQELSAVDQFKRLFDQSIDCYKRMDYSVRELPAIRIYQNTYTKQFESWFVEGDVKIDVIFPASLRRDELQSYQDIISNALMQQFRRDGFFAKMRERVPGLNELGKRFEVDKSLGFEWQDEIVPLTQITLNSKIDLRIWDDHLTQTNRTKQDPFCETIVDLERIVSTIQGLKDSNDVDLEVKNDQKV